MIYCDDYYDTQKNQAREACTAARQLIEALRPAAPCVDAVVPQDRSAEVFDKLGEWIDTMGAELIHHRAKRALQEGVRRIAHEFEQSGKRPRHVTLTPEDIDRIQQDIGHAFRSGDFGRLDGSLRAGGEP